MSVVKTKLSETRVKLEIGADGSALSPIKSRVLKDLGREVKVPGFRAGKVPASILERYLDADRMQSAFLDEAINELYIDAARREMLRPVEQPEITITKFVPFDTLAFTAEVEVVGEVELPDYRRLQVAKKPVKVTAKDVDATVRQLLLREAEKSGVDRPAALGDEVIIDFSGRDAVTKELIAGADGKAYPLHLGSDTFIPGFEKKLVGARAGDRRSFILTFPKDYGVASMQNRKVTFDVSVLKVQAVKEPQLSDDFAAKIGPFKTVAELKKDIKKELEREQQARTQREYENMLIETIARKTKVALPKVLVDDQIDRIQQEERRNLAYRGQTWEEHLKEEGLTEQSHRERQRPEAELRVKIGLSLGEIAEKEGITVTKRELDDRLKLLKNQYTDVQLQAELDKPENRQDILNRLITEKTITRLLEYVA